MRYTFGDCELDVRRWTLRRAGTPVHLRSKALDVLCYLLEHHDRVVSRDELCEQVWPEHYVSDATLSSTMRAVRQAIGDNGRSQQVIRTFSGRGYRFVVPVEVRAVSPQGDVTQDEVMTLAPPPDTVAPPSTAPPLPGDTSALDPTIVPLAPPSALLGACIGERKVVTSLCCALVEAPAVRERLELEALYSLLQLLSVLLHREVQRYGGTLLPVMGDRLVAVFGAPVAQEDHAQRTVLAALGVQRRLATQMPDLLADTEVPRAVSMGVHTAPAVVEYRDDTPAAVTVVGDAVSVAMALQAQAAPGMSLCSEVTAGLVRDVVRLGAVGPVRLLTQSMPLMAYQLLAPAPRLPLRGQQRGRPFLGRARELALLQDLLADTERGRGQAVGLVGAAGMGKSRLLVEFQRLNSGAQLTYLAGRCLPYGQGTLSCP